MGPTAPKFVAGDHARHRLAPANAEAPAGPQVRAQKLRAAETDARVQRVMIAGLLVVIGHHQCLGQVEHAPQLGTELKGVEVLGVQVDGDQPHPPRAVE